MDIALGKLKKVPVASKQELLHFIAGLSSPVVVKITAVSGAAYYGYVLKAGAAKNGEQTILFQLIDERNGATRGVVHLSGGHIESVETANINDAVNIFSLGQVSVNPSYDISGKLDVQRAFKNLSETITQSFGLQIMPPQMQLVDDGHVLNRIIKLTQTILQTLIDILKEEDALGSFKEKYRHIKFSHSDSLAVKGEEQTIAIDFPFNDIEAPEIASKELAEKIYSVL